MADMCLVAAGSNTAPLGIRRRPATHRSAFVPWAPVAAEPSDVHDNRQLYAEIIQSRPARPQAGHGHVPGRLV